MTTPTLDYEPILDTLPQDDDFSIVTTPEMDMYNLPQTHELGARRCQSMPDILSLSQDFWPTYRKDNNCHEQDASSLHTQDIAPSSRRSFDICKSGSSEKRYTCPVCLHRSRRRHNLLEHIQTHNPNRPRSFVCSSCCRGFARKYDMKRHEKIHFR
ncbi:hypothetical protein BDF14DRAFT_1885394 [Spinellus fusiger]|nr:hypothetical protein BDF14DRAFT_1885394 [Spinellus fusiger]